MCTRQITVPSAFCKRVRDIVVAPFTSTAPDTDGDNFYRTIFPDVYRRIPLEVRQLYEMKKKQRKLIGLQCAIDAVARDYKMKPIYVMRGTFKGAFGRVTDMSDVYSKVRFDSDSVWGDRRVVDIPRAALVS